MVRTYYPPYIKTVLKAGAIFHLMFCGAMLLLGWGRHRELWRNDHPKRRPHKAGKFDYMLQVRDERFHELGRPVLDWQPNLAFPSEYSRVSKIIH